MATLPDIIQQILDNTDPHCVDINYDKVLPEGLAYTANALTRLYHRGAVMELGEAGLPDTTRELIALEIAFIEGNKVKLHPALREKQQALRSNYDKMLNKLRQHKPGEPLLLDD